MTKLALLLEQKIDWETRRDTDTTGMGFSILLSTFGFQTPNTGSVWVSKLGQEKMKHLTLDATGASLLSDFGV